MKRTNVVLDEVLLEEALRVAGVTTYSKVIDLALSELVRRAKAKQILGLTGTGLWEGDLSNMRKDRKRPRRR
jgi:Arc/MetJ family transcription regulator